MKKGQLSTKTQLPKHSLIQIVASLTDDSRSVIQGSYTHNVDLAISLSDAISIETLLSFQNATVGDSNRHLMFYRLCKHHFTVVKVFIRFPPDV